MGPSRFGSTPAQCERGEPHIVCVLGANLRACATFELVADSPYRRAPEHSTDPVFDALWACVEDQWDTPEAHTKILDYALATAKLPELAGRYSAYRDDDARREFASKRVAAITLAALNMLEAARTPKYVRPPWYLVVSAMMIFAIVITFVWATLSR